jgi:hypothetical protein
MTRLLVGMGSAGAAAKAVGTQNASLTAAGHEHQPVHSCSVGVTLVAQLPHERQIV